MSDTFPAVTEVQSAGLVLLMHGFIFSFTVLSALLQREGRSEVVPSSSLVFIETRTDRKQTWIGWNISPIFEVKTLKVWIDRRRGVSWQDALQEVLFPTGLRQQTYHRLTNAEQAENPQLIRRGSERRFTFKSDGTQTLRSPRGPAAVWILPVLPLLFPGNPQFVCLIIWEATNTCLTGVLLRVQASPSVIWPRAMGQGWPPASRFLARHSHRTFFQNFIFTPCLCSSRLQPQPPRPCVSDGRQTWEKLPFSSGFCFALRASAWPQLSRKVSSFSLQSPRRNEKSVL